MLCSSLGRVTVLYLSVDTGDPFIFMTGERCTVHKYIHIIFIYVCNVCNTYIAGLVLAYTSIQNVPVQSCEGCLCLPCHAQCCSGELILDNFLTRLKNEIFFNFKHYTTKLYCVISSNSCLYL